LLAHQHEAVEREPQRQRDADPAQRIAAAGAAAEHAAKLVEDAVEGTTAAATAAAAARRPGILAATVVVVAARAAVVVVLAGDVPGHAGSSLGIPPPGPAAKGHSTRCARGRP